MANLKDKLKDVVNKLSAARKLQVPTAENMIKLQEAASKVAAQVKAEKA